MMNEENQIDPVVDRMLDRLTKAETDPDHIKPREAIYRLALHYEHKLHTQLSAMKGELPHVFHKVPGKTETPERKPEPVPPPPPKVDQDDPNVQKALADLKQEQYT